jgi:hypothetical protein
VRLLAAFLSLALVSSIALFWPGHAKAAVTIASVQVNSGTSLSGQRKIIYDPTTSKYWAFFYTGPNCAVYNSTNGSSWSSATGGCSSAPSGSDFSIWLDRNGGAIYQVTYYTTPTNVFQVTKGTLSAGGVSWSSAVTVYNLTANSATRHVGLLISQDGNGRIWVLCTMDAGSNGFRVYAIRSINPDDITSWGSPITVYSSSPPAMVEVAGLVPLSTAGDMYFLVHPSNQTTVTSSLLGYKYTDATSSLSSSVTVDTLVGDSSPNFNNIILSAVAGPNDTVHAVYVAGTSSTELAGAIRYVEYSGGAWGTPVTLDSGTTNGPPTISIDTADKLYAIWPTGSPGNLRYKVGESPYGLASWSGASTLGAGAGADNYPSAAYHSANGVIPVIWTNGTSSYSIMYDAVAATPTNAAPAAPTLSQPASDATSISTTPRFRLRTTDPDSDYLRYDVALYQNDCTTLVRDIDQTSDQAGWRGHDQQAGTAYTGSDVIAGSTMAVHDYQSPALAEGTTYCWKARAKDPGGLDTWSGYSTTQLFTTLIPNNTSTQIEGGVQFRGGTKIGN